MSFLKNKVEFYKKQNTPIYYKNELIFVTGLIRQNQPLSNFLRQNNKSQLRPFDDSLVEVSSLLLQDLPTQIDGFRVGFASSNFFVLYFKLQENYSRDNLNSLFCSRAVNLVATNLFLDPMFLISSFAVLQKDVENVFKYYKKAWLARRNRLIGEMVLGIPVEDKTFYHTDILSKSIDKGFDISTLPIFLREGISTTMKET